MSAARSGVLSVLLVASLLAAAAFAAALGPVPEILGRAEADLWGAAAAVCFAIAASALRPLAARGAVFAAAALVLASVGPRLAADARFVGVLAYYGDAEHRPYPELLERSKTVLRADPGFTEAAVFLAGVLAFDLERPSEALALLAAAADGSSRDDILAATAGGISAVGGAVSPETLALLDAQAARPDCPPKVKRLAAYLRERSSLKP